MRLYVQRTSPGFTLSLAECSLPSISNEGKQFDENNVMFWLKEITVYQNVCSANQIQNNWQDKPHNSK